jgi:4'-phosphopantetheinyl transferase
LIRYKKIWSAGPVFPVFKHANEIHLWRLILPISQTIQDRLCKNLSQTELSRAARFHFDKDCIQFKMGRSVLREVLSRYIHIPSNEIQFEYAEYGKPFVKYLNVFFNVSHSNDYILIAISKQQAIGVDVEYCKPNLNLLDVAKEFCSIMEYQILLSLSESERQLRFYQYWTHKEALVKGLGQGISFPLKQVAVYLAPLTKNFSYKLDLQHHTLYKNHLCQVTHIHLGSEYTAAVASIINPSEYTSEYKHDRAYQKLCFWDWEAVI